MMDACTPLGLELGSRGAPIPSRQSKGPPPAFQPPLHQALLTHPGATWEAGIPTTIDQEVRGGNTNTYPWGVEFVSDEVVGGGEKGIPIRNDCKKHSMSQFEEH